MLPYWKNNVLSFMIIWKISLVSCQLSYMSIKNVWFRWSNGPAREDSQRKTSSWVGYTPVEREKVHDPEVERIVLVNLSPQTIKYNFYSFPDIFNCFEGEFERSVPVNWNAPEMLKVPIVLNEKSSKLEINFLFTNWDIIDLKIF